MKIGQAFTFEAAHRLPHVHANHRCRNMHGHSYRVVVELNGPVDRTSGFVADFFDVEAAVGEHIKGMDHHVLNDIAGLENPTAENIALWLWGHIKPRIELLSAITVYETPNCWARIEG